MFAKIRRLTVKNDGFLPDQKGLPAALRLNDLRRDKRYSYPRRQKPKGKRPGHLPVQKLLRLHTHRH
jgi:hypothetical protein